MSSDPQTATRWLNKKIAEAKIKFAQIDPNSPLKQIAQNLEHYQGLK